jgi:uncharacterized protein YbbC (DUF1343 family)
MSKLLFGIDVLLTKAEKWRGRKLALVTNNAATTSTGVFSRVALQEAGFDVHVLFSPEHGLTARGADGAPQASGVDQLTGLKVISLYGNHFRPTAEDLATVDIILFDIPDAGCRFYTYLWTLTHVMEACAAEGKKLVVLDRPNPLGGDLQKAEGPMLDEGRCASFIGRWNIPVRHSCTLGELALYFNATRVPALDLEIIQVQHWIRNQTAAEAGWYFVPTSPAIRDTETIALYPATCFLEGVNVNEGRGTTDDFKIAGAPWIDSAMLSAAFNQQGPGGIKATAHKFIPEWGLYAGETCEGMRFEITDEKQFRPVYSGLLLLSLLKKNYPNELKERLYITAANPAGSGHLDRLTGVSDAFRKIETGELVAAVADTENWKEDILPFLLY